MTLPGERPAHAGEFVGGAGTGPVPYPGTPTAAKAFPHFRQEVAATYQAAAHGQGTSRPARARKPAGTNGPAATALTADPLAPPGAPASPLPPPPTASPTGDAVEQSAQAVPVRTEEDLLTVRHVVRASAVETGFGLVDQTRIVTAASELARNAYVHGGGGTLYVDRVHRRDGSGLRLRVTDQGPGIGDVDQALCDGFTTGAGLGHGLGGAKRLMDDFDLRSGADGTTVTAIRWLR